MRQYQAFIMMGLMAVIAGVLVYSQFGGKSDAEAEDTTPITVPEKQ